MYTLLLNTLYTLFFSKNYRPANNHWTPNYDRSKVSFNTNYETKEILGKVFDLKLGLLNVNKKY